MELDSNNSSDKLRYQRFVAHYEIEPSSDFTAKTMTLIRQSDKRRKLLMDIWIVALSMGPYLVQRSWSAFIFKHDYFNASTKPFAHYLIEVYGVFTAATSAVILLFVGLMAGATYLFWTRTGFMSRIFDFHHLKFSRKEAK